MGGINYQKWELDYCYTHIIDNTQMSYVLILRWCLHLHPEKLCTAAPCHGWPHGHCCHGCNWRILCDGNGRIHQKNSGNSGKISKMGGSEFMIFFFTSSYILLDHVEFYQHEWNLGIGPVKHYHLDSATNLEFTCEDFRHGMSSNLQCQGLLRRILMYSGRNASNLNGESYWNEPRFCRPWYPLVMEITHV